MLNNKAERKKRKKKNKKGVDKIRPMTHQANEKSKDSMSMETLPPAQDCTTIRRVFAFAQLWLLII